MKDKIFTYKLLDSDYVSVIKTGRCLVKSCHYEKSIDCNVYDCEDIDSGFIFSENKFRIILKEEEK